MKICIARREKGRYSETFIRNQIEQLSQLAEVYPVYDGRLPQRAENGSLLAPTFIWLANNIVRAVTGKRNHYFGNYGLKQYLRTNKIDVVVAHYGMAGVHILPVCRSLGIPLVVHFHGFDATQKKVLDQYGSRYKRMFDQISAINAVSGEMRDKLISLGAREEIISVIPYGVNVNKFHSDISKKKMNTFLAVGRFTEKKSPMSTIRAFAKVKVQIPDVQLIMIGKKDLLYRECEALTKELGLEKDIEFTGIKTPDEIIQYMQEANVFVQHSVTAPNGDKEGTPNTVMEAAACQLPVVSTFHAGIPEAVIHDETGWLVKEHDVDEMARYMILLINDSQQALKMGEAGRRHIEQHYNLQIQIKKLFEVLKQIVENYK